MNAVFLDTSGLIAVVNVDDQWHAAAERAWHALVASGAPMITSSLVLIEIADGLARVRHRQLAVDLYDRLHEAPQVEVVQVTPQDEDRAWKLFRERDDKEWGLTDCVSIVIMEDRKATKVFSSDHHFEQAGFHVLLRR